MVILILDKKIIIQVGNLDQDSFGQSQLTWSTFAIVYANIKPLVGKEFLSAQQITGELTHDITIRYRRGIKSKMRISYLDRYFDIQSVIDKDEKRQWMYLKCKELV